MPGNGRSGPARMFSLTPPQAKFQAGATCGSPRSRPGRRRRGGAARQARSASSRPGQTVIAPESTRGPEGPIGSSSLRPPWRSRRPIRRRRRRRSRRRRRPAPAYPTIASGVVAAARAIASFPARTSGSRSSARSNGSSCSSSAPGEQDLRIEQLEHVLELLLVRDGDGRGRDRGRQPPRGGAAGRSSSPFPPRA